MAFEVTFTVLDPVTCYKLLNDIEPKIQRKVIKKAVRAGGKQFAKAAKSEAPKDTGMLRRSMTTRVKSYGKHYVLGVIGPRRFKYPNGRNPANYAHLVELGHRVSRYGKLNRKEQSITIAGTRKKLSWKAGTKGGKGTGVEIGYAKPNPFMTRAAASFKRAAMNSFTSSVEKEIGKAVAIG